MNEWEKAIEETTFSNNFKKKMNRLFREQVGIKEIPHPEVDTLFEKIRSSIIVTYYKIINKRTRV